MKEDEFSDYFASLETLEISFQRNVSYIVWEDEFHTYLFSTFVVVSNSSSEFVLRSLTVAAPGGCLFVKDHLSHEHLSLVSHQEWCMHQVVIIQPKECYCAMLFYALTSRVM